MALKTSLGGEDVFALLPTGFGHGLAKIHASNVASHPGRKPRAAATWLNRQ